MQLILRRQTCQLARGCFKWLWARTDLRFHLMLSLYTSWEKYYGAESASFPVVHGDFGCNVTCQACRENSPRMTIGTPRLARTAQTCLGRRLGPQNLTNYTFFYLKPMQLIQYKWYTLMFRCKRSLTILAGTFTVTFTVATYTESVTRTVLWLWVPQQIIFKQTNKQTSVNYSHCS